METLSSWQISLLMITGAVIISIFVFFSIYSLCDTLCYIYTVSPTRESLTRESLTRESLTRESPTRESPTRDSTLTEKLSTRDTIIVNPITEV